MSELNAASRPRAIRVLNKMGVPDLPAARRWAMVAIVDALGTGLVLPIAVLFFTKYAGLSAELVGLGLAIAGGVALVTVPLNGILVDRFGPKPMLVTGYLLGACGYFSYVFAHTWTTFLVVVTIAQVADHASKPARQAFVASIVQGPRAIELLAFQRTCRNVGYGAGGLIAAALLATDSRGGYVTLVVADAISYVIVALLILSIGADARRRSVPAERPMPVEDVEEGEEVADPAGARGPRGYGVVLRDRRYMAFVVLNTLLYVHAPLLSVGMPVWVADHTEAPDAVVGILFALSTVVVVLFQVRTARGMETVASARRLYRPAAITFALGAAAFALAHYVGPLAAVAVLAVATVLHTAGEVTSSVGGWTASLELAEERWRGRYLSVFAFSSSVQQAFGPALILFLISRMSVAAWAVLGAVAAIACLATVPVLQDIEDPAPAHAGETR